MRACTCQQAGAGAGRRMWKLLNTRRAYRRIVIGQSFGKLGSYEAAQPIVQVGTLERIAPNAPADGLVENDAVAGSNP